MHFTLVASFKVFVVDGNLHTAVVLNAYTMAAHTVYYQFIMYIDIKTHGSESRGQEEAAYTHVFWPTLPLQ